MVAEHEVVEEHALIGLLDEDAITVASAYDAVLYRRLRAVEHVHGLVAPAFERKAIEGQSRDARQRERGGNPGACGEDRRQRATTGQLASDIGDERERAL